MLFRNKANAAELEIFRAQFERVWGCLAPTSFQVVDSHLNCLRILLSFSLDDIYAAAMSLERAANKTDRDLER
ncbi:MAG: hypothetical protein FWH42_04355 [Dehalococcoidia bacterium]|nr:hypothetical protein [Dehalococcoidia bacterium]